MGAWSWPGGYFLRRGLWERGLGAWLCTTLPLAGALSSGLWLKSLLVWAGERAVSRGQGVIGGWSLL